MRITFSPDAADLAETFRQIVSRYGYKRVTHRSFGLPIVRLADSQFAGHAARAEELEGVRACLLHLTLRVRWHSTLGFLPLPFANEPFASHSAQDRQHALIVTDSLILTTLKYRDGLRAYHSNLAPILFSEIVAGFEWMCDWVERGVPIERVKNELLVPIEPADALPPWFAVAG